MDLDRLTDAILARCDALAACTESPGRLTRTFLCPPFRQAQSKPADEAARERPMFEIVDDVWMVEIERAVAAEAIALFGDGAGDQADCRVGELPLCGLGFPHAASRRQLRWSRKRSRKVAVAPESARAL